MINAKIKIDGEKPFIDACFTALEPEQEFKSKRAKYNLKKDNKNLDIKVEASDLTSFRAVMNSITGLLTIVNQNWRLKDDN